MFEMEYKKNIVKENVEKHPWFPLQDKNWATFDL